MSHKGLQVVDQGRIRVAPGVLAVVAVAPVGRLSGAIIAIILRHVEEQPCPYGPRVAGIRDRSNVVLFEGRSDGRCGRCGSGRTSDHLTATPLLCRLRRLLVLLPTTTPNPTKKSEWARAQEIG